MHAGLRTLRSARESLSQVRPVRYDMKHRADTQPTLLEDLSASLTTAMRSASQRCQHATHDRCIPAKPVRATAQGRHMTYADPAGYAREIGERIGRDTNHYGLIFGPANRRAVPDQS